MRVDYSFICDYADVAGKVNALGIGIDTLYAPNLPWKHTFFFVMQIRTTVVEAGEKRLEIHIIDQDGHDIIPPLRTTINISKPTSGLYSKTGIALQFGNVEFKRYGSYSVRATIDGNEVSDWPLTVTAPPPSK